jgi:hypothetical protein
MLRSPLLPLKQAYDLHDRPCRSLPTTERMPWLGDAHSRPAKPQYWAFSPTQDSELKGFISVQERSPRFSVPLNYHRYRDWPGSITWCLPARRRRVGMVPAHLVWVEAYGDGHRHQESPAPTLDGQGSRHGGRACPGHRSPRKLPTAPPTCPVPPAEAQSAGRARIDGRRDDDTHPVPRRAAIRVGHPGARLPRPRHVRVDGTGCEARPQPPTTIRSLCSS